jgi:hypothetical protein
MRELRWPCGSRRCTPNSPALYDAARVPAHAHAHARTHAQAAHRRRYETSHSPASASRLAAAMRAATDMCSARAGSPSRLRIESAHARSGLANGVSSRARGRTLAQRRRGGGTCSGRCTPASGSATRSAPLATAAPVLVALHDTWRCALRPRARLTDGKRGRAGAPTSKEAPATRTARGGTARGSATTARGRGRGCGCRCGAAPGVCVAAASALLIAVRGRDSDNKAWCAAHAQCARNGTRERGGRVCCGAQRTHAALRPVPRSRHCSPARRLCRRRRARAGIIDPCRGAVHSARRRGACVCVARCRHASMSAATRTHRHHHPPLSTSIRRPTSIGDADCPQTAQRLAALGSNR